MAPGCLNLATSGVGWGPPSGDRPTSRYCSLEPAFETMCNLYSSTTNETAISALFRVVNRYVGNLAPMPGVFPDYPAVPNSS
jgi:hypothetical protein